MSLTQCIHYICSYKPSSLLRQNEEAGFSVLEALVAIAVLAMALLPILALQGQFVRSVAAIERAESQLALNQAIIEHIRSVDLSANPRGQLSIMDAKAEWQVRPETAPRRMRGRGGLNSRYEATLYNVEISVKFATGGLENLNIKTLHFEPVSAFLDGL